MAPTDETIGGEHTPEMKDERLQHLEDSQRTLWRVILSFLVLVAFAFAVASWEAMQHLGRGFAAIPVAILVLVTVLSGYVYGQVRAFSDPEPAGAHALGTPFPRSDDGGLFEIVRASQGNFRELVDSLDAAVFTVSIDTTIRAANRRFAELLHRSFQEVIGQPLDRFLVSPDNDELRKALDSCREGRRWSGLVRALIATTHQWKYLDCSLQPIVQEREVRAISVIANDVTGQREREARFTNLFETLHEAVFVCTRLGDFAEANAATMRLLASPDRASLLSKKLFKFLSGDALENVKTAFTQAHPIIGMQLTLDREDGTHVTCLANIMPVTDAKGSSTFQGTLTDITQRYELEKRFWKQQEFRECVLQAFPDVLLIVSLEGRISFLTPSAGQILGFDPAKLLGTPARQIFEPQDHEVFDDILRKLANGRVQCCRHEFLVRDWRSGALHKLHMNAVPMRTDNDQITSILATMHEITSSEQAVTGAS